MGASATPSGSRPTDGAQEVSTLTGFDPSRGHGWWAGTSDEYMNIGGPVATREAAIEMGRDEQCGDPFYIVHASIASWSAPDAASVIDNLIEGSDELFFEDGFDGFDGSKEDEKAAEDDLQEVLNAWFERHKAIFPTPTAFANCTATEHIDAIATEAGTAETENTGSVHEGAGPQDIAHD